MFFTLFLHFLDAFLPFSCEKLVCYDIFTDICMRKTIPMKHIKSNTRNGSSFVSHLAVFIFLNLWLTAGVTLKARTPLRHVSLDASHPIVYCGDHITYQDREITLDDHTLYLDGTLPDSLVAASRYAYNSFTELAKHLTDGTEERPMTVFLAPYVYWIDDPDDPAIRKGKDGREPFGLEIHCENLHLVALNPEPRNTVLAAQRGQAQGAVGNFTMFDFWGDGLYVENLTMGNFCNVDLEYPLMESLGRKKRMSSITQAHVAYCHGDRAMARNVRFISRLNMNPLSGDKRILFYKCHMESTDDALAKTGVYLDCDLDFWGERPFWRSDMGGGVFLNCDFNVKHHGSRSFFCKSVGPVAVVDSRIHATQPLYFGWTNVPADWLRSYQYGVRMNGEPYIIGADKPYNTICMEQKDILHAYRLIDDNGDTIYNTYNLLRGDDGWDPLHVKDLVERIGRRDGRDYANLATCLSVTPLQASVQTGASPLTLRATVKRHCNYPLSGAKVRWKVQQGYERCVNLSVSEGGECVVTPCYDGERPQHFTVIAYTDEGLECATELTVLPSFLEAPKVTEMPVIEISRGQATLRYSLDLAGRNDESVITWYKSRDKEGRQRYPVAVTRGTTPVTTYPLKDDDAGFFLLATLQPKHLRSMPGETLTTVTAKPVTRRQVRTSTTWETDFRSFPSANQPEKAPGLWTLDGYKPLDTQEYEWDVESVDRDFWTYGEGLNGAKGLGLYQNAKGARMLYTPLPGTYGDMNVMLHVDAAKLAGQGFGSPTGQYMDIYIKFDSETLSGYALRIERTTKYSNAVDFTLVRYDHGVVTPLTAPVSSSCYRTNCFITLRAEGGVLTAHAETTTSHPRHADDNVVPVVDLSATIDTNPWGGYGIQHTGSAPGESITMLHKLSVEWIK